MKIPSALAAQAASSRYKFLRELSLYLNLDVHLSLNIILSEYQSNPELLAGVIIPTSTASLSKSKINLIASGEFECRAYLAQICLDYILKEGYRPHLAEDKKLVALMFLTRYTVKTLDDAIALIPTDWPQDTVDELVNFMEGVINE